MPPMGNVCSGGMRVDDDVRSPPPPLMAVPPAAKRLPEPRAQNLDSKRACIPISAPVKQPAAQLQQQQAHPAPVAPQPQAAVASEPAPAQLQAAPFSWSQGELIGVGAFGRVFQGLNNNTGELMAVKQVALAKDENCRGRVADHIAALEAEVSLLRELNHENIVRYFGTERTPEALNIFLEFVPGGSIAGLLNKFGPLPEPVVRNYTRQILRGLDYLHKRKIMHRDIKGANILVDKNGTVKLADFGASKQIEDLATINAGCKSIKGTPYWMAPEVIKQTGHGRPADIWSLGCVVIEMLTGRPPWSNFAAPVAAMFQIASTNDPPPIPENASSECRDFLLLCFNRTPQERANADRLLRHPFVAAAPGSNAVAGVPATASAAAVQAPAAAGAVITSGRPPLLSPPSPIKEEASPARPALPPLSPGAGGNSPALAMHERDPPRSPTVSGRPPLPHGRSLLGGGDGLPAAAGPLSSALPTTSYAAKIAAAGAHRASMLRPDLGSGASRTPPLLSPTSAATSVAQPSPQTAAVQQQQQQQQPQQFLSVQHIPAGSCQGAAAASQSSSHNTASSAGTSASPPPVVAPAPVPPAPPAGQPNSAAVATRSHHHSVRSSVQTLDYNPMEEPSWAPVAHDSIRFHSLTQQQQQQQQAASSGVSSVGGGGGPAMSAIPEGDGGGSEHGTPRTVMTASSGRQASSSRNGGGSASLRSSVAHTASMHSGSSASGSGASGSSQLTAGAVAAPQRAAAPGGNKLAVVPDQIQLSLPSITASAVEDVRPQLDQPNTGAAAAVAMAAASGTAPAKPNQQLDSDVNFQFSITTSTATAFKAAAATHHNHQQQLQLDVLPTSGSDTAPALASPQPQALDESVRASKMERWRHELLAELEKQRQEARAARTSTANAGLTATAADASPVLPGAQRTPAVQL